MNDDRYHRAVYVISVAAELVGMHPQTLRICGRQCLLEPDRTDGVRRRYGEADLALLERIAELTEEGINLAGVQRILDLEQQVSELTEKLEAQTPSGERRSQSDEDLADLTARGFVPERSRTHSVTLFRSRRYPIQGSD